MIATSKRARLIVYVITGITGVFLALLIVANINNLAYEDNSTPEAIKRSVSNAVSEQLLNQINDELQTSNPCLQALTAKPAKEGISYSYYDAIVDKRIYPAGTVRVVALTKNDYQITASYSDEGACQYRPNKDDPAIVGRSALSGPFILDPANSKIIANTLSKSDQQLRTAAISAIDVKKPIGSSAYTQTVAKSNPNFDITKCCRLTTSSSEKPNPDGDYNASF